MWLSHLEIGGTTKIDKIGRSICLIERPDPDVPGTILLTLVPGNEPLQAEVMINNDDVGFVHEGQSVKLKLAAYPFQKYGMVEGIVTHVSADAADGQGQGKQNESNQDGQNNPTNSQGNICSRQCRAYSKKQRGSDKMNAPENFFARNDVLGICTNAFANFVANSIEVRTTEDFVALINHSLQPIFPHGMMIAGVGHVQFNGIMVQRVIGINYPEDYVSKLQSRATPAGPILTRWIKTQEPQLFDVQRPSGPVPRRWLNAAQRAGIQNIAAHGMRDSMGPGASYFTFSQIPGLLGQHQRRVLATVVPHLYCALRRVIVPQASNTSEYYRAAQHRLTPRELQILYWLSQGKSDAFIATTMNRSIFTINNHVKNILAKLGAENRTQAVAKARGLSPKSEALNFRENS